MSKILVLVAAILRMIQAIATLVKDLLRSVFESVTKSATGVFVEDKKAEDVPESGWGASVEGERRKEKESAKPEPPPQPMIPPPPAPRPVSPPAPAPPPSISTPPSTGEASSTDDEAAAPPEPEPQPEAPPEPVLPPIVGETEESDEFDGLVGAAPEDAEEEVDVEFPVEEKINPDYLNDLIENPPQRTEDEISLALEDKSELSEDVAAGAVEKAEASPAGQPVEFTAYYPKEVVPGEWKPLTAYVYKAAFADVVTQDAKKHLGSELSEMREVGESTRQPVAEGALITATPYLTGFRFNPPCITVGFYEDWHCLDFKLQAKDAPLQQATNGYLTFTVEGIIVADIPLSVFVGQTSAESEIVNVRQKLYQAIFCSYSHDDTPIIERVERAYKALGLDYLRDVCALKSGQDWDDQLLTLIEQADIFQLFWSQTAAESPYVRQEWEYALKLDRDAVNFIRPVYWKQPMPAVPPELGHIHFAYQPDLDD